MGQEEVRNFLRENIDKWFTAKEISKGINQGLSSVTNNCKVMRKNKELKHKNRKSYKGQYVYEYQLKRGE
tara:strand:+ start:501 stop:710 length:210 start_codon:yes stop_codon:yes gene_type:complete